MSIPAIVENLYEAVVGKLPKQVAAIKGSGSSRNYFRVGENPTLIATVGDNVDENQSFIYLTNHFKALGLPVPEIFAISPDGMAYIQSDNGSKSLFEYLDRDDLIVKAVEALADIQFRGAEGLDFDKCYPVAVMDSKAIMWDLNYFKYCFLKNTPVQFSEVLLENDFERLASDLAATDDDTTFMFRDFQSRNVMIDNDDNVTLIDYQGGRRGPVEYDVASFAWQARAGFSAEKRAMIVDAYLNRVSRYKKINRQLFLERLKKYVFLRQLQTLGAYGYRGLVQQKAHFVRSISSALANLAGSLPSGYSYLGKLLGEVISAMAPVLKSSDRLTVKVGSFSYMQGIPADMSGNGGGFVFDCRGLPNPGRYDQYKSLTGRDAPVIEFLNKYDEIHRFVESAISMTSISVATYLERGFSSLMINFGCTGGRHRSVYCAEQVARYLHQHFNVNVELCHREQNIKEILSEK